MLLLLFYIENGTELQTYIHVLWPWCSVSRRVRQASSSSSVWHGGIGECAIKSGNASGRGNYEWNGIGCRRAIDPGYSVVLPDGQHHPPAYITGGC